MRLKGHEKFPLREGWLTKGINGVIKNNRVFSGSEGPDILGVGSNMVKSIRYWMQSFNLIEENPRIGAVLTEFGQIISKYDLYLEDYFSLWLLHSNIAKNSENSTAWYLFFYKSQLDEFKKNEMNGVLRKELTAFCGHSQFNENSLNADLDVILNMYSKENVDDDPEDKNKSPLALLGLLKKEKDLYYKVQPDLRKFNAMIILYELAILFQNEDTISIDYIYEVSNCLYNLNRVTLNSFLDKLDNMGYIKVDRTAGLDVVYPVNVGDPVGIIKEYYESR